MDLTRHFRWAIPAVMAAALALPALGQEYGEDDGWFDWNWNENDYRQNDYDYGYTQNYGTNADLRDEELDDVEWDQQWGYHEEEWYDPSDWFDADRGIEYEDDSTWGYGGYGTGYGYGDYYDGEDQYGYYNSDYDWQTDDDAFEDWYGDADEGWDWF